MKSIQSKALIGLMLIALLICSSGCIISKLNAMFTPPVPIPATLTNGLVALYFYRANGFHNPAGTNNGAPTDYFYDQVGTNNGMPFDTTPAQDRFGDDTGGAFYFDGSSSYIRTLRPMQDLTNATFSIWFKASVTDRSETLMSDSDSGTSNYCKIVLVSDGRMSNIFNFHDIRGIYVVANKHGAGNGILITNGIDGFRQHIANNWVNLIWVMQPANQQIFVNGVEVANVFATANDVGFHGNGLVIGADDSPYPYQNMFCGSIDNIWVYNRALSANEANQLYNFFKP
jgi:Concanavalin A-like lectin/glucanases superfamily